MSRINQSLSMWLFIFPVIAWTIFSCDDGRLYETNHEFVKRNWVVTEIPTFEFVIPDSTSEYNLYFNVRNSLDYPYARIFVNYQLSDSTGAEISKKLVGNNLFDQKTGKPQGESGLGDVYDHQFSLLTQFRFKSAGKYSIRLSQFMRQDTLPGVLAVGIRVEKYTPGSQGSSKK